MGIVGRHSVDVRSSVAVNRRPAYFFIDRVAIIIFFSPSYFSVTIPHPTRALPPIRRRDNNDARLFESPIDFLGFNGHAEGSTSVPFLDSQSTSSYTSDMSDYIETLSLSSHSSSDTNNEIQRWALHD